MPKVTPLVLLLITVILIVVHLAVAKARPVTWKVLAVLGVGLLASGGYLGLSWAPPEREMGDVYRIIYVHVPAQWMAFIGLTINFGACVAFLLKKSWVADSLAEASAEVGLLFGVFGTVLGSIWAKPTW